MNIMKLICLALALVATSPALAKPLSYELPEDSAAFKPGAGVEAAQNNCAACHSADYIKYQPSKKGTAFWDAEVQKMIKVYGAPIDAKDARAIADYLAASY